MAETETTETISPSDLIEVMEQRADAYAFIGRLYRKEVDQELLDSMHAMRYPQGTGSDDIDTGYRLMATYLSNIWDDTLLELAKDYVRCFLGNGIDAYSAAYPFESVYTSEKRLTMQDARDEVLALYRSEGLDKDSSWKDSEDHISLECEFMQKLAARTAQAIARGDGSEAKRLIKVQQRFQDDHLYSWAPMMTAELKKFANTDLYRGLAYLTDGFFAIDHELLSDIATD